MEKKVLNNYGSFDITFTHGQGSRLWDTNGKEYIDFLSGIAVNCLGHNHQALTKAIQEQAAKQLHISNYYMSDSGLQYADNLLKATGFERAYFANSGAEANEAAIKLVRKYGWMESNGILDSEKKADNIRYAGDGVPVAKRHIIYTLEKSFHGRTLATLKATGQKEFHPEYFAPYPAGFKTIKAGDFKVLESAFDETTAALFIECVQGEGGVNLIDKEWAQAATIAAHKAGALVVCDEVQTGMGRTGKLLASDELDIKPDVLTLAKAIAGGLPMGACLFKGVARDVFVAGDHQSTFAGNPLVCVAANVVLAEVLKPGFMDRVVAAGEYIVSTVSSWESPLICDIRGKGLMLGFEMIPKIKAFDIQVECLKQGLCCCTAGKNTLRFLPPLIITDEELDAGLNIFKHVLEESVS
ncbi:MAG TPA: aminotransferase class III-fold pyridoxal phosphate-dependent enzyme [Treponemataceae bacterium]|nr:aminotransferase class III-fold pyridoxal phosphate-dependent enzyme [Treponemataceae bacterium]